MFIKLENGNIFLTKKTLNFFDNYFITYDQLKFSSLCDLEFNLCYSNSLKKLSFNTRSYIGGKYGISCALRYYSSN